MLDMSGTFLFISGTDGKQTEERNYVIPEYRKGSSQDVIIPLVRKLAQNGEKVI
jgi:helicase